VSLAPFGLRRRRLACESSVRAATRCSAKPSWVQGRDVLGDPEAEGFVSIEEAASRMEISEAEVLELARSAYLLSRWNRGSSL
jgi:hypothetical protein